MSKIILPVKHRQQQHTADCIAACAAMVLDYLNEPINYDRLLHLLRIAPDFGAPAPNLRFLEQLGVTVIYKEFGSLDEIRQHLENHLPCIAFLRTGELPWCTWDTAHAVVIIGMDDETLLLHDPALDSGSTSIQKNVFDLAWLTRDETYAVIKPKEE